MELFKDYKNNLSKLQEGEKEREAGMADSLKKLYAADKFVISDGVEGNEPYIVTSDSPEFNMVKGIVKKRYDRAKKAAGISESENADAPLFADYKESKNTGISYLTEEENQQLDDMMLVFESEYEGKITKLDEGFFGKLVGGAAGFLAGPMIGKIIARALGIEKGILYDMLTSRLVSTALGAAIGKAWTEKK